MMWRVFEDPAWNGFFSEAVAEARRFPKLPRILEHTPKSLQRRLALLVVIPGMVKTLLRGQNSYERRTALTARYEQLAGVDSDIAYIQVGSLLGQLSQLAAWPNLRQLGTPPNDGQLSDAARAICRFLVEGGGAVDGEVEEAETAWVRIEDAFGSRAGPSIQAEAMSAHQEFASAWRRWWDRPTTDGRSQ